MKPTALALLLYATQALADPPPCPPGAHVRLHGLGTPTDDLLRVAELAGAAVPTPGALRRGGARDARLCADGPALPWAVPTQPPDAERGARGLEWEAVPLRLDSTFNSRYPSGANDGLLWAGRGASGLLSGGVSAGWRFLSASFAPELAAEANEPFDVVPNGQTGDLRFMNPFYGASIDLPQRFGSEPRLVAGLGQSYLRADLGPIGFGVSNENLWFGPGRRNGLLMTNAGPGFPHVFLGTSHPADVRIGTLEALLLWGRLGRSRYFPDQGDPLFTGFTLGYTPRWVPGLTLGLARAFVQPRELTPRRLLAVFESFQFRAVGDDPQNNQLTSLFFRWLLPAAGLEVHVEWGREDYEHDVDDFLREPDHAQAWIAGLEKVWLAGPRWVRLQAEVTHLQEKRPLENSRGIPVWYTHGNNRGYTNEGQLLGAWIGPGGDAQTLALDVFSSRGRIGGFLERVRRNEEFYWRVVEPLNPLTRHHDTELTGGVRGVVLSGPLELGWEAALQYRWYRDFVVRGDGIHGETNVRLGLSLAYTPGGPAR